MTEETAPMDVWAAIDEERKALLVDLDSLQAEQWDMKSLCDEWRVRDVVGHLVFAATSDWKVFAVGLVKHRGNLDRFLSLAATKNGSASPSELHDQFAGTVGSRVLPPFVKSACELADIVCHGEDIRRPLGLHHEVPTATLEIAAQFLKDDRATGTPKRIQGLRLVATDAEWSLGQGPTVEGPFQALVMVMAGRAGYLDELTGDGVPLLRERMPSES